MERRPDGSLVVDFVARRTLVPVLGLGLPVAWRARTWNEPATRRLRFVHVGALGQGQQAGDPAQHRAVSGVVSGLGQAAEQARAHDGLARAHHRLGDHRVARTHWRSALVLHTQLDTPQAVEIARTLRSAVDGGVPHDFVARRHIH